MRPTPYGPAILTHKSMQNIRTQTSPQPRTDQDYAFATRYKSIYAPKITPQGPAMVAIAAPSGQGDSGLLQTPLRSQGIAVKEEQGTQSPQQTNNQISHSQQVVRDFQPFLNRTPHPLVPTNQQHPQSPELVVGELSVYVNSKQFHRILKRRKTRQRLGWAYAPRRRKQYLHQSRHNHAVNRARGPNGRFLTAQELAERDSREDDDKQTPAKGTSSGAGRSSTKRKADTSQGDGDLSAHIGVTVP